MRTMSMMFAFAIAACSPAAQSRLAFSSDARSAKPATDLLVMTEPNCPAGRSCDIVQIVDLHTDATSEDKGFDELRAMAKARQADAVISAEFEHGGDDKPSHLSGVIVRYGRPVPPHTVLGEIEVPSAGTDRDKGLTALLAKAHAMSGDQVIDVTFEHGEDGAMGLLKGRVIRFDR